MEYDKKHNMQLKRLIDKKLTAHEIKIILSTQGV